MRGTLAQAVSAARFTIVTALPRPGRPFGPPSGQRCACLNGDSPPSSITTLPCASPMMTPPTSATSRVLSMRKSSCNTWLNDFSPASPSIEVGAAARKEKRFLDQRRCEAVSIICSHSTCSSSSRRFLSSPQKGSIMASKKSGKSGVIASPAESLPSQQAIAPVPALPSAKEEPAPFQLSLENFVKEAWKILEPVSSLQWNWHHSLICEYLTLIKENQFKETCGQELEGIIFNVPPRTMKSLLITVFFPVWVWTSHPSRRFMFVSYSEKLSTQHSVFRRSVIESPWYQERWGGVFSFSKDQNLKSHYENSKRGAMFSTGMQATATGLGGGLHAGREH